MTSVELYSDFFYWIAFPGQTGSRASGGTGSEHQESGLLVQTHHTYRLHYRGGQELLHSLPKPVSLHIPPIIFYSPRSFLISFPAPFPLSSFFLSSYRLTLFNKASPSKCTYSKPFYFSPHQDFPRSSTWVKSVLKWCGICLLRIWSMQWRVSAGHHTLKWTDWALTKHWRFDKCSH